MPTVSVVRDLIFKAIGRTYSDEEFDELCFQYGLEVDDIVDDPEKGITYKIEVGANRYDLLCIEGISRSLSVYLGTQVLPNYRIVPAKEPEKYKLIVKPNTAKVRPYVVGAVLRNIKFNQDIYDSFIDLQDKLHQNLARKRTLVAIGTHDLDTITGPFIYDAKPPQDITFIPLNQTQAFRADKLLEFYSHDSHIKEFVPIIKDKPVYPVISDQNGVVLSLPPIINGNHSKITLNTRNIFIECTATDKLKAQIVLDTLVCMFSGYCEQPYTAEPVLVEYPSGEKVQYPTLLYRDQEATVSYCNTLVGVSEDTKTICQLLTKMSLDAEPKGQDKIIVKVPPTRYDILHECDIAEDFAVAYGFDRLAADMQMPPTNTTGQEFQLNYLSDKMRLLMSQINYTETCTFSLCSTVDMGERMRIDLKDKPWVKVGNPKTTECEAVRISLLPGLLKTVAANKHIKLPLRIFEVSDVVIKDSCPEKTKGVGARNERHLCAINYNVKAGIEIVQGLLDNIMIAMKVPFSDDDDSTNGYYIEEKDYPCFFPGFSGDIIVNGVAVGQIGLIHPEVLTNYNLNNPASALEINLEKLVDITNFGQ